MVYSIKLKKFVRKFSLQTEQDSFAAKQRAAQKRKQEGLLAVQMNSMGKSSSKVLKRPSQRDILNKIAR